MSTERSQHDLQPSSPVRLASRCFASACVLWCDLRFCSSSSDKATTTFSSSHFTTCHSSLPVCWFSRSPTPTVHVCGRVWRPDSHTASHSRAVMQPGRNVIWQVTARCAFVATLATRATATLQATHHAATHSWAGTVPRHVGCHCGTVVPKQLSPCDPPCTGCSTDSGRHRATGAWGTVESQRAHRIYGLTPGVLACLVSRERPNGKPALCEPPFVPLLSWCDTGSWLVLGMCRHPFATPFPRRERGTLKRARSSGKRNTKRASLPTRREKGATFSGTAVFPTS